MVISPMSKRGELLKACLDKKFSYEMIMEYTERLNSVPEEEREEMAGKLAEEIKNMPSPA